MICEDHGYKGTHTGLPKYHDNNAIDDVISYVLDRQKTLNGFIGGYGVNPNQAAYEMSQLSKAYGKNQGLRLRHMIISFDEKEMKRLARLKYDQYRVLYWIAQYAAAYYGCQYQTIYAVHEDTWHGHIHIVMSSVNFKTGKKYEGKKEDYYGFQRYLRDFLGDNFGLPLIPVADRCTYGDSAPSPSL